jgi:phage shock protein C
MFCTSCGHEVGEKDRFCPQCAHATGRGNPDQPPHQSPRLTRDLNHKKIAGVCAGFARYLDVDVVLIRVIWLALAFCTGIGFIAYVIAWIIVPREGIPPFMAAPPEYAHPS